MTHREMAESLGIGRSRVTQLVARGMPIDTVENARTWRTKNDKRGTTRRGNTRVSLAGAAAHLAKHKPVDPGHRPSDEDPGSAIWRAREAERLAYEHYASAVLAAQTAAQAAAAEGSELQRAKADAAAAPLQMLLRAHGLALSNRLLAERTYEKYRRTTGDLAPIEHLENVLDAVLGPLMARLQTFPAIVAPSANPAAPGTAESAISAALDSIRKQIGDAMEAQFPPPPSDGRPQSA